MKKHTPVNHVRHRESAIKGNEHSDTGEPGADLQQPAESSRRGRRQGRNTDEDDDAQEDQRCAVI